MKSCLVAAAGILVLGVIGNLVLWSCLSDQRGLAIHLFATVTGILIGCGAGMALGCGVEDEKYPPIRGFVLERENEKLRRDLERMRGDVLCGTNPQMED